MQRHLNNSTETIVAPAYNLSVEEEAILADQLSESEIGLDGDAEQLDRLTEISEVANDTTLVVSDLPEVGQVETDLVDSVASMAVAGTDIDPEDILSVTNVDAAVSVEGIASALKSIWDAIVTAIKNMWVGLKHWLTTYFSSLEQNKRHAEELLKRFDTMKGWLPAEGSEVKVNDIFNYGGQNGTILADLFKKQADVEQVKFREFILNAVDCQHKLMVPIGEGLVQAYNNFKGDGEIGDIGNVLDVLVTRFTTYLEKLDLTDKSMSHKEVAHYSRHIANMKVEAKGYNKELSATESSYDTKVALMSKVRLSVSQNTDFSETGTLNFKDSVTIDILKGSVQRTLDFINDLIKFKSDQFSALEKQVDAVEKACTAMLNRVKQENKEGVASAKRLMSLTSAYANWATQPAAKLLSLAARHNKFWLVLAEQTANNFRATTA